MDNNLHLLKSRGDQPWVVKEEVRTADISYKIEVSSNELIAVISIKSLSAMNPNLVEINEKLKSTKLQISNQTELENVLTNIIQLSEVKDLLIAKGIPPKHGMDAEIKVNFESSGMNLPSNEVAKIDYKEINKIVSVKEGAILAHYIKETEGENGTDVYGKPILAHKGKPVKFLASKNVILDEVEMVIKSSIDGIPSDTHGVFKVEPALMIEKDVDLSVGNLNFTGSISVNGDVLDGFKIHSEGDIYIKGTVGASEVTSVGKIIVHGGVAGKGKCFIKCKELQAKFLHEVHADVDEKILIQKEIIGSTLFCNGTLEAGVIIGGRTVVRDSIDVSILGSEQNVETIVDIGTDVKFLMAYEKSLVRIPELEAYLKKEIELFNPFLHSPSKLIELPPEKLKAMRAIFEDFKIKAKERKDLDTILHDSILEFRIDKHRKKKILIHKFLNENIKFNSRFAHKKVVEAMKGPLVVKEDLENKTFIWTLPI